MRAVWLGYVVTVSLAAGLWARPVRAEQILTTEGESISAAGVTITNRQLTIPPTEGGAPRQILIDDLVEYSQTINRELGELKTRYVRVESLLTTNHNLSLAEVLVFEGDKNVAREGKATQAGIDYGGNPERAIDGNTNGDFNGAQSTSHTAYVPSPWWELDLQRDVKVRQLDIWNRTDDGLHTRLDSSRVILLDANRKPLWVHYIDKASAKRMILKVPPKGSQFGREDVKQFERYAGVSTAAPDVMTDKESRLELVGDGKISGKLNTWTAEALSVELRFGDQTRTLAIPPAMVQSLWSHEVATDKLKVDRAGEPADQDSVYAKNDAGAVQRVSGQVIGREGESLSFEFEGKVRQIGWAKVAGVTFRKRETPPEAAAYELVDFVGGQRLPGSCQDLTTEKLLFATLWKESLELPRAKLARFTVKNDRIQSLLTHTPTQVEQIGYLDLVKPYQVNKSFTGEPLQIGDVKYTEGLCTHSRTLLTYDLGGHFDRFRSEIGLQKGAGDQGHVIVRILVDGTAKFEEAIAGGQAAKPVKIDLMGAKTLQLEVDFGEGFDVADHLVWGSPVLLKAAKP